MRIKRRRAFLRDLVLIGIGLGILPFIPKLPENKNSSLGFKIPAGFPADNFAIRVHGGENIIVAPKGKEGLLCG